MEWLLWVAGALIALGAAAYRHWRDQQRRREVQDFATTAGLRYAANDPFGTVQLGFRLFREGDGRGVDNVCWGSTGGLEVRLFDYWYYEESRDGDGHTRRRYRYHTCALFRIPGVHGPRLTIEPEGVFSRLEDAVGFRDLQFESEDFNRAFQVTVGGDERFAYAVIDAAMMDWLLRSGGEHRIETMGDLVLVSTSRVPAAGMWQLLSVARGFRNRIPSVVADLYPGAPHQRHDDVTTIPTPYLPDTSSSHDDSIVPKWTL